MNNENNDKNIKILDFALSIFNRKHNIIEKTIIIKKKSLSTKIRLSK